MAVCRRSELQNLSASPEVFEIGTSITSTVDLLNSGTYPLTGTLSMELHHHSQGLLASKSFDIQYLEIGHDIHIETLWDSSYIEQGSLQLVSRPRGKAGLRDHFPPP
jgi:hypothetical protein